MGVSIDITFFKEVTIEKDLNFLEKKDRVYEFPHFCIYSIHKLSHFYECKGQYCSF